MDDIAKRIEETGIVPVIKLNCPARDAGPLSDALTAGGVPAAEVTFRAAGAAEAIRIMRDKHPEMLVGAGTVLNEDQAYDAVRAGAMFIVTPGLDQELVRCCKKLNVPVFPGCSSPTDYHAAYRLGLDVIKFFPAEQSGGLEKIKALSAPFPMFRVMPTGGISLRNLKEYISCPVILACGGSYMVRPELIDNGNWEEIEELCRESVRIVKEARRNG